MNLPDRFGIRRMTASDLDAVLALEQASDRAPHWSREDYQLCLSETTGSALQRIALVAEATGRLAGFSVLRLLVAAGCTEAELESIVVAAEQRGQGIGRMLMGHLIELARSLGATSLDLEVRASNAQAIRLYHRAGLSETGRRRGYYRGPEDDAVLMSITW